MSALLSFLGGSAFRMFWGEVASFLTKRQEFKQEIELTKLQGQLAKELHERNLEALRVQNELGIKEIYVKQEAATNAGELDAWIETVNATHKATGIRWVDAWNQSIRPLIATMAILSIVAELIILGHLTDFHREVFGAALGLFIADRSLSHRGK